MKRKIFTRRTFFGSAVGTGFGVVFYSASALSLGAKEKLKYFRDLSIGFKVPFYLKSFLFLFYKNQLSPSLYSPLRKIYRLNSKLFRNLDDKELGEPFYYRDDTLREIK